MVLLKADFSLLLLLVWGQAVGYCQVLDTICIVTDAVVLTLYAGPKCTRQRDKVNKKQPFIWEKGATRTGAGPQVALTECHTNNVELK